MIENSKSLRTVVVLMAFIVCMAFMPLMMIADKASAESKAATVGAASAENKAAVAYKTMAADEELPYKVTVGGEGKTYDVYDGYISVFPRDFLQNTITVVDDTGVSREFKYTLLDYYDKDGKRMADYGFNIYETAIWQDSKGNLILASDSDKYINQVIEFSFVVYKCNEMGKPLDKDGNVTSDISTAELLGMTDPIKVKVLESSFRVVKNNLTYCLNLMEDENSAEVFCDSETTNAKKIKGKVKILKKVTINGKKYPVTRIGAPGLMNCKYMTDVVIPDTITWLEEGSFVNTGLKKITIPDSVKTIASGSIGVVNEKPVKGFVIYAKNNPEAEEYALEMNLKYIDGKAAKAMKSTIKSATSKSKKVTLKWKKNKYVTGYQIFSASKKNGKYKKAAYIKNASETKWTSKKLKAGKKVFFKMRAVTKISDKTFNGKWSKVKSVKIR